MPHRVKNEITQLADALLVKWTRRDAQPPLFLLLSAAGKMSSKVVTTGDGVGAGELGGRGRYKAAAS